MKLDLVIAFSSGRTSAFMTMWLLKNMAHKYNITVVFANVGKELEQSLAFADMCDKHFNFNLVWIEAITRVKRLINGKEHIMTIWQWKRIERRLLKMKLWGEPLDQKRIDGRYPLLPIGVAAKVVDFETADRKGRVFEASIAKHGMPNKTTLHCTRELKTHAMRAYAKSIGLINYYTAIGIRKDEVDRMNPKRKEERLIYPLISMVPMAKSDINKYWRDMPFDLDLKSFEGNCDACWKKSLRKLLTIAKHNPQAFDWWLMVQKKYEEFIPSTRIHNEKIKTPIRFYRNHQSVEEIIQLSTETFDEAIDESKLVDMYVQKSFFDELETLEMDEPNGCEDSCEPFGADE